MRVLLGMGFQQVGVSNKKNKHGVEDEVAEVYDTELTTAKGDWCTTAWVLLLALLNIFHSYPLTAKRRKLHPSIFTPPLNLVH